MKNIKEVIKIKEEELEELWDKLNSTNPYEEPSKIKMLSKQIEQTKYYILGLKDAKKYIEEEGK